MQQRDLLKDQIEQLGRTLGKVIAEFLGLKNQGDTTFALEQVIQNLKTALNFELDHLDVIGQVRSLSLTQ